MCSRGPTRFSATKVPPSQLEQGKTMGVLTDFKKEIQQTKFHASHLVHVEVPVNSLPLKHNATQLRRVRKGHQHEEKKGRPYHKTIPIVFASRLLQVGDN